MAVNRVREFIRLESASGIVLFSAAVLALLIDNSAWQSYYRLFFSLPISIHFGVIDIAKPLQMWINDGLMALFFFLVGLEIKHEMCVGELSSLAKSSLPIVAAIGGMVVPALIYVALNWGDPISLRGWAIPTATDIAFSLAILSLFGSRLLASLRVFLTALAIIDDLGAIMIIAFFYTDHISTILILVALCLVFILVMLNRCRITFFTPYFIIGAALWLCVLKSGVHATLVGVILAMAIPIRAKNTNSMSPVQILIRRLHPWVAFGVLPVFAFANSGVSFSGINWASWVHPTTMGIILGLFFGKQLGIFLFSVLAIKCGISVKPRGMTVLDLYGVALVAGIGFTMSLFVGSLAFEYQAEFYSPLIRLGVLTGSILSGLLGYFMIRLSIMRRERGQKTSKWLSTKWV